MKMGINLGVSQKGTTEPPGGEVQQASVSYYLLEDGIVRAVIDDRHGRNRGCFGIEWITGRGEVTRLDGATIDEAAGLARDHVTGNPDLLFAWRLATVTARASLKKLERPCA